MQKNRILGIDPALNNTGWAVLDAMPDNSIQFVDIGHISNKVGEDYHKKLAFLRSEVAKIVEKYAPSAMSIEETFVNMNALSSLKLGVARGVIMSVAFENEMQVMEFRPNQIKSAITGVGKADKQQVQYMSKVLVPKADPKTLDESDALAIALTGLFELKNKLH